MNPEELSPEMRAMVSTKLGASDSLPARSAEIVWNGLGPNFWHCAKNRPGWLFAADEADAEGEGAALAAGESAEIGGVEIVDDGVGILAVEGVDGFDADAPEVAAKAELFSMPRLRLA
jgi:hypothetical protein